MKNGKIAYIMSRFPHLPETFILREMDALSQLEWEISLFPLILQKEKIIHSEAAKWLPNINYTPFISIKLLFSFFTALIKNPLKIIATFSKVLWGNRTSAKFLSRAVILFPKLIFMASTMKNSGVQHIHAHYATHPTLAAWVIHNLTGIPYSFTVHAHDIFVNQSMLNVKLDSASFIVAISDFNKHYLSNMFGPQYRSKIHVIHCGIDPSQYSVVNKPEINPEKLEVLTIGSLQPYKGQKYLIEACSLLKARGVPFRCRIIGGGELKTVLQRQIDQNDLNDEITLLGPLPQDKVAELILKSNCYVQPSIITPEGKMEGIPVSIMEALAAELPVIATEISGIPELIIHSETGYLIPPNDPIALAKALEKVYAEPGISRKIGRAGSQFVLDNFEILTNTLMLSELFSNNIRYNMSDNHPSRGRRNLYG